MKYKQEVASPNFIKDELVSRSRHHAFNRGISAFVTALVGAVVINYAALRLFDKLFLGESLICVLCFSLYMYGNALNVYTEQDRDIILSKYLPPEPMPIIEQAPVQSLQELFEKTELPHPSHKNGRLFLSMGLTQVQLERIAKAGLEKNSLPINLLESYGLSRQTAERLRMELAAMDLGYFTDKDRFMLTADGQKVFAKIIRKS